MLRSWKNHNMGKDGENEKKWASKVGRIVWTIMESTTPWLANRVSQHLLDQGKNHLYKVRWKNCNNRQAFDCICVQNL